MDNCVQVWWPVEWHSNGLKPANLSQLCDLLETKVFNKFIRLFGFFAKERKLKTLQEFILKLNYFSIFNLNKRIKISFLWVLSTYEENNTYHFLLKAQNKETKED